jgi:hypothetical protein
MRKAYLAAHSRVAKLAGQYGRDTVLGWLETGLPAEITAAMPKTR